MRRAAGEWPHAWRRASQKTGKGQVQSKLTASADHPAGVVKAVRIQTQSLAVASQSHIGLLRMAEA